MLIDRSFQSLSYHSIIHKLINMTNSTTSKSSSQHVRHKSKRSTASTITKPSKGPQAFSIHYNELYKQRWQTTLLPTLLHNNRYCALINKYSGNEQIQHTIEQFNKLYNNQQLIDINKHNILHNNDNIQCIALQSNMTIDNIKQQQSSTQQQRFPEPHTLITKNNLQQLLPYYPLDFASILCVDLLFSNSTIDNNTRVLDICSAPGGKALVLSQLLYDQLNNPNITGTTVLHLNELSQSRRQRLHNVLKSYIIGNNTIINDKIRISSLDATHHIFPHKQYTHILVDAPCSSTRHVLHDDKELQTWNIKTIKTNAQRQIGILLTALKSLKPNTGRLLYSTCSIDIAENDNVIEIVLKRTRNQYKLNICTGSNSIQQSYHIDSKYGELTKYGVIILPDQYNIINDNNDINNDNNCTTQLHNWGPIYMCLIEHNGDIVDSRSDYSNSDSDNNSSGYDSDQQVPQLIQ